MKKENEKQNNSDTDKQVPCYGGSQYRWNYDEYQRILASKKTHTDNSRKIIGIAITVVFAVALISLLAVFVADAVLRAKGASIAGLFTPQSMTSEEVADIGIASTVKVNVETEDGQSTLSGTVFREDGYILTSAHAVSNALSVAVEANGKTYSALIVSKNEQYNVAILKIDAENLQVLKKGCCTGLNAGTSALITGMTTSSPGDKIGAIPCSVTNSQILAKLSDFGSPSFTADASGENGEKIALIQLNAMIADSTVGSPLLNMNGEIIGFIVLRTADGIGYAVPVSSTTLNLLNSLVDVREIERLSVEVQTIPTENIDKYKLSYGCRVLSVEADGAAARAGIQVDDTIISVNGEPIYTALQLEQAIAKSENVTLIVCRGSECCEIAIDEK